MMTALSTVKENCGTRGIITRLPCVFFAREMIRRCGVTGEHECEFTWQVAEGKKESKKKEKKTHKKKTHTHKKKTKKKKNQKI